MSPEKAAKIFLERFKSRYGTDFYTALPNPGIGGGKTDNEKRANENFNPRMYSFLVDLMSQQIQDVDTETEAAENVLRVFGPIVTTDRNKAVIAPSWEKNDDISDIEQFVDFKQEILDPVFTSTSNRGWWWRGNPATQEDEVSVQSEGLGVGSGTDTETVVADETEMTETTHPAVMLQKVIPVNELGQEGKPVPYGVPHGTTYGPKGQKRSVYRTWDRKTGGYTGFETWEQDANGNWSVVTTEQEDPIEASPEYTGKIFISSEGNRHPIFAATNLPDLSRSYGPAFQADQAFKPVLTTMGDRRGYLDQNNQWVDVGDNTTGMSEYERAFIEAGDRRAQDTIDQQKRQMFQQAKQYDAQNMLTLAQQQLQAAQQAQQARTSLAQLGLQAADQTSRDFLTFNEILNNPQSALSSMNWMRGAVDPTEENRFGESSPMDRLGQLNQARSGFNQYLNDLYSAQLQQAQLPQFQFGGSGHQNQFITNELQAWLNANTGPQPTTSSGDATSTDDTTTTVTTTSEDIQPTGSFYTANTQPNFATATPDMRFNPVFELSQPTTTTRDNAAIAARIAELERNRNRIAAASAQGFRY